MVSHNWDGNALARLPEPSSLLTAARERFLPLDVLDRTAASIREMHGADLVLVRPDQHIAWRGNVAS